MLFVQYGRRAAAGRRLNVSAARPTGRQCDAQQSAAGRQRGGRALFDPATDGDGTSLLMRGSVASNDGHSAPSSGYMLLTVLFIHGALEGAVVGTALSRLSMWSVTCIIAAHKWVESLALGVGLEKDKAPMSKYISMIVAMSLACPIGIYAGMAILTVSHPILIPCFGAFAAGVLLYVAMCEVIKEEFDEHNPMPKLSLLMFFIGSFVGPLATIAEAKLE
eukprot:Selendium_serpulae@DN7943_c0_g1_i1.p2